MRTIVVAYGMNDRAIGAEGKLPWENELPADLRHFSQVTKNTSVIMGRKTYESLPDGFRPLPNRQNIVLSMSDKAIHNVHVVQSLEQAYKTARYEPMIIGGGQIYDLALPTVNKVIATEVLARTANADTFFPKLPPDEWEISKDDKEFHVADNKNKHDYFFITYLRRNPIEE